MTEQKWLAATDPMPLLTFLFRLHSPEERKFRLFCCACCRWVERYIMDGRLKRGLEIAERFADRQASTGERVAAETDASFARSSVRGQEEYFATEAVLWTIQAAIPVRRVADSTLPFHLYPDYHLRAGPRREKEAHQAGLLRDIFGNPFRPVAVDPTWLSSTVVALAAGIYAERAFDRVPILADALQDGGCDDEDVLSHCRSERPHVRGCWVIDFLLGKE